MRKEAFFSKTPDLGAAETVELSGRRGLWTSGEF